jgi:hypothetical protein
MNKRKKSSLVTYMSYKRGFFDQNNHLDLSHRNQRHHNQAVKESIHRNHV